MQLHWSCRGVVVLIFPGPVPAGYRVTFLGLVLDGSNFRPGEAIEFAWKAYVGGLSWSHADLDMFVVDGADELPVWNRHNIRWPPPLVTPAGTDGIWPPVGFVSETLSPLGAGRTNLYAALGNKHLRLRVTGYTAGGIQTFLSDDADIDLVAP